MAASHMAQHCPVCSAEVAANPRYPRHLCTRCATRTSSVDNRLLVFFNVDSSGGYRAQYADTGELYGSHTCFVDGVECRADEARFGGIVIEALEGPSTPSKTAER